MPSENSIQLSGSKLLYAILGATIQLHVARLQNLARKAGFRPEQPRVPAGHPDGGEWVDEDGDADLILIGGDPEDISKFPEKPPPTTRKRNVWAICVAKYLWRPTCSFRPRVSPTGFGTMPGTGSLPTRMNRNILINSGVQQRSLNPDTISITLSNKRRLAATDLPENELKIGAIWCAFQPIDIGRSRVGMGSRMTNLEANLHATI